MDYTKSEMTYDEYKKLYQEYIESDSVKKRNEILEKITPVAFHLIKRVDLLYRRYGNRLLRRNVMFEIDHRKKSPLDEKFVFLCYDDFGNTDEEPDYGESVKVNMELLEPKCLDKLACELRERQITSCETANENYEIEIEERTGWMKQNNELKEKLMEERGKTISEIVKNELKENGLPNGQEKEKNESDYQ